jgi:plasmid stability protein
MTLQQVTIQLPHKLLSQIRQRAAAKHRSVDEEMASVVEAGLTTDETWAGVPADIAEEVEQLRLLEDEYLWRTARLTVPDDKTARMQFLIDKQLGEGLTEQEQQETKGLQHLAHRVMLLKAEAALLLQERGFDISQLRQLHPEE